MKNESNQQTSETTVKRTKSAYTRTAGSSSALGLGLILVAALSLSACASKPVEKPKETEMITLPRVDEHGNQLMYSIDAGFGPKECGAVVTPKGTHVWVSHLSCLFNCSTAVEQLLKNSGTPLDYNAMSNTCDQACKGL